MRPLLALLFLALPLLARAQWSTDSLQNTIVRDSASHDETTPLTAPGPAGSTYVSWFEAVPGTNYQLRMQRLDSTGRPLWPAGGRIVSALPQNSALFRYDLKSDLQGDALVAFQDERSGTLLPVIYKVAADGSLPWGNGILLTDSLATGGLGPVIGITTANNVLVAWNANAGGAGWIAARKFSPTGTPLWSSTYRVRDGAGTIGYTRPGWLAVGPDDAILSYVEQTGRFPFTSHTFARRLSPTAATVWTTPLNTSTSLPFVFFPTLVSDGMGGALLVYDTGNPLNATLPTVYAQRLRPNGTAAWGANGAELLTGTASVRFAASDGGAVLTDSRAGSWTVLVTQQDVNQNMGGLTIQQLDSSGSRLLGSTGVGVMPVSASLHRAVGLRDAGNDHLLAVFTTGGGLTQSLSALSFDPAGAPHWNSPRFISAVPSGKSDVSLLPVRGNELVVAWADDRLGGGPSVNGIYAQSISTSGHLGGSVITGLSLAAALSQVSIWPNPATEAWLQLPATAIGRATLTLRDATGRLVHQQQLSVAQGIQQIPLPTTGLPSGLYLTTLTTPSGRYVARWVRP